ncbi:MAG: pyridoxal-phosphate dependent enzyme [Actinobacteria bacterium]|nr:pyridoxal-phosphate dependent enzyme [Actinomycetota bacterium]
MTPEIISERLEKLPQARVSTLPTPLHPLRGLSAHLSGREVWTKREDLTGLAFGGNKARELDFIVGEAVSMGADVLIAGGGVAQSNHGRQCAAAARAAGLDVELVLRRGLHDGDRQGNQLISELLGARIHWVDEDPGIENREGLEPVMRRVESDLRSSGRSPYVLVSSFHPLSAAAYIACMVELCQQIEQTELAGQPLHLWVTSLGATHVGLALGIAWLELPWALTAVAWRPLKADVSTKLSILADETAALLGFDNPLQPDDFTTVDHGGPAYGIPSDEAWSAIRLCAHTDGFLLDPVYTGKGMAGFLQAAGTGSLDPSRPAVFVHTGGQPALFAYRDLAIEALSLDEVVTTS